MIFASVSFLGVQMSKEREEFNAKNCNSLKESMEFMYTD